ncbi:hypothetical protein ACF0H5_008958 [Mactra antiquata]
MSSPRRQCELKLPEDLVAKMEAEPEGIKTILARIEKEYGMSTTCSYIGKRNYTIVGPNPDILEMAIDTLLQKYLNKSDKSSEVSGEIGKSRRAVWKFQGDYAVKVSQLFRAEIEEINKIQSVHVIFSPLKMEITASYDDVEQVKQMVEQLQQDVNDLKEAEIQIENSHAEIVKLRQFIQRKLKFDQTVVCLLNDAQEKFTVFARSEDNVRRVLNEWEQIRKPRNNTACRSVSPSFSFSSVSQHPKFKSEMKIPGGIVRKLEKQRGGISCVLSKLEKEFGLKVQYARKKHLIIYGPHLDILELAAQTLVHKYVIKSQPENGVIGQLQGKNAVWKFTGTYAKKVVHLFTKDMRRLQRIRTVTVKSTPCKANPTCVEVLCSIRVVEIVKANVEKIVGLVHNLFEKQWIVPEDDDEKQRVKEIINVKNESEDILCLYDDVTRAVTVYGRNEILVIQAIEQIQYSRSKHGRQEMMPDEYWNMYRQFYQTKISEDVVKKLEKVPGGIMPMVERIEKEYGVKTLYHQKKQMVLISPSEEVLQLAQETLETRYVNEIENDGDSTTETSDLNKEKNEDAVIHTVKKENPHFENKVYELYNKNSPLRSRGKSRSPTRSVLRSPSKSPCRSPNRTVKKVVFAQE